MVDGVTVAVNVMATPAVTEEALAPNVVIVLVVPVLPVSGTAVDVLPE